MKQSLKSLRLRLTVILQLQEFVSCVQQDGAASLKSILDNFETLLKVWEISLEQVKDTEMKARIRGAATLF